MRREAATPDHALLSVRSAVVLILALLAGLIAGALAYLAHRPLAESVLTGLVAAGAALTLFGRIIER